MDKRDIHEKAGHTRYAITNGITERSGSVRLQVTC
jgi:hypothetical protein